MSSWVREQATKILQNTQPAAQWMGQTNKFYHCVLKSKEGQIKTETYNSFRWEYSEKSSEFTEKVHVPQHEKSNTRQQKTFDLLVVRWKDQQNTECVLSGQRQDVTPGTWTSGGGICLTNSPKQWKTSLQKGWTLLWCWDKSWWFSKGRLSWEFCHCSVTKSVTSLLLVFQSPKQRRSFKSLQDDSNLSNRTPVSTNQVFHIQGSAL